VSFVPLHELKELTGRKQPSRICRWLAEHDWVFEEGADGLPKVDRRYYDRRLTGGIDERPQTINENALKAICGTKVQK
jgi:hypothetical protein